MKYLKQFSKVRGPYTSKHSGRSHVVLFSKDGEEYCVSYPKFLVEVVLGRRLDPRRETVDHINGNFNDNSWNNLRVVGIEKHAQDDALRVRMIEVCCVWCGSVTFRPFHEIRRSAQKCKAGPFCSRTCVGVYSTAKNSGRLKATKSYEQWSKYVAIKPVYYTWKKGGETVLDMAARLDIRLPTEEDILKALPRPKHSKPRRPEHPCAICGAPTHNDKHCSRECTSQSQQRARRPTAEKLKELVWKYPTTQLAKHFGVSDKAVTKWCQQYGIDKPPRGYWTVYLKRK